MLKIIPPGAQDFGEPVAQLIKLSSRGLFGSDRQQLIKRAGAQFADRLDHVKFAAGEVPIHQLIVGADEFFGGNRNGDAFPEKACISHHHTFQKHGRWYRDHCNKDPAKSYGIVKLSFYNEAMRRIELVVALNGTEEAARRNGGLLADRELEKLANDKEIATSMACRVPFDVCSHCGNRARNRGEYCMAPEEGGHCKAGGLKSNIGRILADGTMLRAMNTEPDFFDDSHVFRPAERIAFVTGQLEKAASSGVICGAALADAMGLTAPYELLIDSHLPTPVAAQLKLACLLAEVERTIAASNFSLAFAEAVQPLTPRPPGGHEKFAEALHALATSQALLPVRDFLRFTTTLTDKQASEHAALVQAELPGIYGRLLADPAFTTRLQTNPYMPAAAASIDIRLWATKQAAALSLAEPYVTSRMHLAAIRGAAPQPLADTALVKAATANPATQLAEHYALYKLGFLVKLATGTASSAQEFSKMALTRTLVVLHNYVR